MSRVGRKPIVVPEKVQIQAQGAVIKVKGPLGELARTLHEGFSIETGADKLVRVKPPEGVEDIGALFGSTRAIVANMVEGVAVGFKKLLEIHGLGFRALVTGEKLTLTVGYSHTVDFIVPKGIKAEVDAKTNVITVSGVDKELVGQTAARIRSVRPPEPYKGTGIRYRGEHIVRKAGKTAAGAGAGAGGGAKK
jgi:large subunit ribosomal protein L6